VNQSAGPLPDGCAPLRLISMAKLLLRRAGDLRPRVPQKITSAIARDNMV
jgi:hypothetical protein